MEVDAAKVVVYKRLPCETVSRMLVNYHGIIFACGLLLIFILSAIGSQNMQIAENVGPSYDFTPNDHPAVESFDAISAADKKLDSLTGTDKPLERSTGDLNYGFMQFLYKSTKITLIYSPPKTYKEFALMNSNFTTTRSMTTTAFCLIPKAVRMQPVQAAPLQL